MTNKTISDYYANLQYDEFNETKAIADLSDLSRNIIFVKNDNFSKRFLETAIIIEKNLFLFQSFCEHVDIVTNIIEYLNYYGMKFAINKFDKLEEEEKVIAIISTLFNTCMTSHVQSFLLWNLLQNSDLEGSEEKIYDQILDSQYNEAIILEDADFYTAIKVLNKFIFDIIWIQEPLAEKMYLFTSNKPHSFRVFRSKQELLNSNVSNIPSAMSIWSEDIIAAKDLAASLNTDVIFINTFMDTYGSIILLPRTKKLDKCLTLLQDVSANSIIPNTELYNKYNLFYDGMWQKPVKDTYWLNENHLWANATYDDIKKCTSAAKKGAKIWSAKSIDSRIQVLFKLAYTLECNSKHKLADIISKWIKSIHFYGNLIICPQSGRLEVTIKRKPRGIITLKAKSLDTLFEQLTLALITGNSVIVLCNSVYCTLVPYCDMFSTSGIPPGVINMLLLENVENVLQEYYISETELLLEENKENLYIQLTKPNIILLPVK